MLGTFCWVLNTRTAGIQLKQPTYIKAFRRDLNQDHRNKCESLFHAHGFKAREGGSKILHDLFRQHLRLWEVLKIGH